MPSVQYTVLRNLTTLIDIEEMTSTSRQFALSRTTFNSSCLLYN